MPALLHRHRDAKLVLAVVIVALIAAGVLLALTGHHVPDALNSALVGAVGSLAGVSLPSTTTAAVEYAESALGRVAPAGELAGLREDVDRALYLAGDAMSHTDRARLYDRIAGIEATLGIAQPAAAGATAGPLPTPQPTP